MSIFKGLTCAGVSNPSWSDMSVNEAITILSVRRGGAGSVTLEPALNIILWLPPKYMLLLEFAGGHMFDC